MEAILNTPIQVLDNILALNLDINIWSARAKLTAEDFGETELPPDELTSLGSKKICDPEKLKVFNKLKKRAFTVLDRNGVRFLSGWAIPEDKAGDIIAELCRIRDDFYAEKAEFIASYDVAIEDWINAHPMWASIIAGSTVSREHVEKRIGFSWQLYRVLPVAGLSDDKAMAESGLMSEVENLGGTLFYEITKDADDIWKKVFEGKTEVTHKALSPLKTMREKLNGLSFRGTARCSGCGNSRRDSCTYTQKGTDFGSISVYGSGDCEPAERWQSTVGSGRGNDDFSCT